MVGVLLGTLLMGCVEKFEADLSDLTTEGLVVEGDIISDSVVVFQLSKTLPLTATGDNEDLFENYKNVDAQLSVKGSDGTSCTDCDGDVANIGWKSVHFSQMWNIIWKSSIMATPISRHLKSRCLVSESRNCILYSPIWKVRSVCCWIRKSMKKPSISFGISRKIGKYVPLSIRCISTTLKRSGW